MTRFVVLLGGDLTVTRRLKSQIQKAREFLASKQASYVTGAIIPMDGGASAVI